MMVRDSELVEVINNHGQRRYSELAAKEDMMVSEGLRSVRGGSQSEEVARGDIDFRRKDLASRVDSGRKTLL